MTNHAFVDLNLSEAKRFSDLAGIRFDVEQARRFALRLIDVHQPQGGDFDLSESFTVSMIVIYARIFTTGVREKVASELLGQLSVGEQQLHDTFIHWRDKHISHSVNSFERNQPVARYVAESVREQGISQVGIRSERIVVPSSAEVYGLVSLLDRFLISIRAMYEEEHLRLLAIVRARPIEEILHGPSLPRAAGDEPIHKKRNP